MQNAKLDKQVEIVVSLIRIMVIAPIIANSSTPINKSLNKE
jgi:hypothetical protein